MGISVPTRATPTVALAPDLDLNLLQDLDMSNEPALFSMDGSGLALEEDNINTYSQLTDDIDQAQVR
jgi:hypothetical protein